MRNANITNINHRLNSKIQSISNLYSMHANQKCNTFTFYANDLLLIILPNRRRNFVHLPNLHVEVRRTTDFQPTMANNFI